MKRILTILFLTAVSLGALANPHPFTFEDMIAMDRIGGYALSPDGTKAVLVVRDYSLASNSSNADLIMLDIATGKTRRLTTHEGADFNPIFSTDGKRLFFLSSRSGSVQIYALPLDGGEPQQITRFPLSISDLKLSPKGTYFSFSAAVYPDTSDFDEVARRDRKRAQDPCTAQVYEELFVRHWDTWEDGKWRHVFYMPVSGGDPVDIMRGMAGNCPSEPFGGAEEYNWSPDEQTIAFTTKLGRDRAWTTNFDVYTYRLADGKRINRTAANTAWDTAPLFSPDGTSLYYLAMKIPGYEADRFRIVRLNLRDGSRTVLTESFEVSPADLVFSEDGTILYFTGLKHAHVRVWQLSLADGAIRELVSRHTNHGLQRLGQDLFFLQNSLTSPSELVRYSLASGNMTKVSGINDKRVADIQFSEPEEFWFTNRDGVRIHGWLLRPVPFDPSMKYPLAFYIHGGPQGSWEDNFHYRWNLQILPAQGYVAVAIDFRGSTGYGDAFREAISKHWGDRPFHDLMDGLDYVLKTYPFIDKDRMGALGASYGGYMINWIAGNAPDRFRCLINHDGGFDEFASYYNTEELWFPEYEFGGPPHENPELYDKWSPARYVKNWKTPMLVIHGGRDYRVVDTEGLSTFNALQRKGIPSRLIYFPDENHWVLKPVNSRFWHQEVIRWMDRWCK